MAPQILPTILEPEERIHTVQIDGLALLKIVKHCHESLPSMVTGSLLGLATGNGVLEISHAFSLPESSRSEKQRNRDRDNNHNAGEEDDAAGLEGTEYQLEMMRMLREVNVDNNCVGWYQSMYLGIYSTSTLLENQWSYQQDLTPNAVVILFDPLQTTQGNLVLKCYRLSDQCVHLRTQNRNVYVDPSQIFEEVPVTFSNPGLVRALLTEIADARIPTDSETLTRASSSTQVAAPAAATSIGVNDLSFDRLDLSTNPYLEKHLEFLSSSVDDLAAEQQKFAYYARQLYRSSQRGDDHRHRGMKGGAGSGEKSKKPPREDHRETWASSNDAPKRMESLLLANQIRTYCNQMDRFTGDGLGKLYLAGALQPDTTAVTTTTTTTIPKEF